MYGRALSASVHKTNRGTYDRGGDLSYGSPATFCLQTKKKRRGWDSNPRDGLTPPTRLPIALLRPTRTPLRMRRTGVYQIPDLLLRPAREPARMPAVRTGNPTQETRNPRDHS